MLELSGCRGDKRGRRRVKKLQYDEDWDQRECYRESRCDEGRLWSTAVVERDCHQAGDEVELLAYHAFYLAGRSSLVIDSNVAQSNV